MPSYTFCDKDEIKEHVKAVPVQDILSQHRKRFVIQTEKAGTIVLRYLPHRMKKRIDTIREYRYPNHRELEEELEILYPLVSTGECDDEMRIRFFGLVAELKPSLDIYMIGCVEYPFIHSTDEIDALLDALTNEERDVLMSALEILTMHAPPDIDTEYLELADRFRVPVIDKDLLDNMTLQEYEILHSILKTETDAIRRAYRGMGVET